jgi:formate C-acetyltransferase
MDGTEGGMKWPQFTGHIILNGYVDVDNSLAAMKKVVFEDHKVSMAELVDALRADFKDKEDLRHMLLSAPKFGNDDDFVDTIARDVWDWTGKTLNGYTTVWGTPYHAARQGITLHYHYGKVTGALPSGRKAFEPLTDGSLSPMRGTDVKGPTAVVNSASKMDALHSEATLLNQKINPAMLSNEATKKKFLTLITTFFEKGGYHIQWNMIGRDTLLSAKKNPEKHRDLLVRVAGYSAFFVELAPEVQDEIIGRTEQVI